MTMLSESSFYQRQTILDEVGAKGQQRLKDSHVLVIGAGGLGSPLLEYIVIAGVGNITIMDFDTVSVTNLHRQILFTQKDIGKNKAFAAKRKLQEMNPLINIISDENPFSDTTDISQFDMVVDCSDNFKSKFSAHDKCFKEKKPLLIASIHKFEGQMQLFDFSNYSKEKSCLRCLWPVEPSKACVQSCEQAGVIGAVPGVIGTLQALEVIKYLLGLSHIETGETLLINLLEFNQIRIKNKKNTNCPLCSDRPQKRFNTDRSFEVSLSDISPATEYIISLIEKTNVDVNLFSSLENIENDILHLALDSKFLVICNKGITSLKAVKKLRKLGYSNCFSIHN